ncbi:THO complex subunit 6 [Heracleum sosnowskyi]|uniref:THO complex subunit 6 n=1 Tax=Heracleum sosnowskyi TaxID=360622 RepID=A0AAD8N6W3_9APIA|nr:THO complex subunit 6 [Heracleum sosnowskyi]
MVEKVDCRNWDSEAYKHTVLQDRLNPSLTIFRTAFPPQPLLHNPDLIVAASSDGSIASYSLSSSSSSSLLVAQPNFFLKAHDGPAYDVKFYASSQHDPLLLSCGDDGCIRGWKWKPMSQASHLRPVLEFVNPQHKGPWNSLSPIPENNAIAVDDQGGCIYVAAGDSCAYCWDVEKSETKTVFKGHSDYLHSIITRNSGNQIITGSEDGTARVWDCKSGKCVSVINEEKDKKLKEFCPRVSCIALDASESWLACGSGQTLSVWNLPACERISQTRMNANIQDIIFDDNQIVAVGAEPLVSRFDMNGALLSQIQCFPQSVFSASLHPLGVTAVAGYGGIVDVLSQFGSHSCTFRCRCL